MATITYGWGNVIRKKQMMGYAWCPSCGSFAPRYLSKLVFRVHISYIPIFMWTKGYLMTCKNCKGGVEITKDEFKNLKKEYKPMSKSMAKKCFNEIKKICQPIGDYNETILNDVISQISQKYPVAVNETLKTFYSQLVTDVICAKLENQRALAQAQVQAQQEAIPAVETMA